MEDVIGSVHVKPCTYDVVVVVVVVLVGFLVGFLRHKDKRMLRSEKKMEVGLFCTYRDGSPPPVFFSLSTRFDMCPRLPCSRPRRLFLARAWCHPTLDQHDHPTFGGNVPGCRRRFQIFPHGVHGQVWGRGRGTFVVAFPPVKYIQSKNIW